MMTLYFYNLLMMLPSGATPVFSTFSSPPARKMSAAVLATVGVVSAPFVPPAPSMAWASQFSEPLKKIQRQDTKPTNINTVIILPVTPSTYWRSQWADVIKKPIRIEVQPTQILTIIQPVVAVNPVFTQFGSPLKKPTRLDVQPTQARFTPFQPYIFTPFSQPTISKSRIVEAEAQPWLEQEPQTSIPYTIFVRFTDQIGKPRRQDPQPTQTVVQAYQPYIFTNFDWTKTRAVKQDVQPTQVVFQAYQPYIFSSFSQPVIVKGRIVEIEAQLWLEQEPPSPVPLGFFSQFPEPIKVSVVYRIPSWGPTEKAPQYVSVNIDRPLYTASSGGFPAAYWRGRNGGR